MKRIATILLVAGMLWSTPAQADVEFAHLELDRYLKLISPDDPFRTRVVVDPQCDGGASSYLVKIDGRTITVTGSDDAMALQGVYYVLDEAGCRFLAPNFDFYHGAAEFVPHHQIKLTDQSNALGRAWLKFRKIYVEEGRSHNIENLRQIVEWMPKVGYNTLVIPTNYQGSGRVKWDNWRKELTPELQKRGITIEVGGHGYQNLLNAEMDDGKLFETHPEFFGQDEKGERSKAKNHVFCTSNAAAVDYLINNFVAYVKERPEIQIYDFWPPDGAKWCECEACKKLGSPPDRQAILIRQVQERAKAVRPGLRLEMIAYAAALGPPQREKIDEGVLVDFCPINQQFDHQINDLSAAKNKDYADALLAWRKAFDGDISIYSYYRKYAWDSLPVIIPHYMQKDLVWYAGVPIQGVSTYAEPGDWFAYELNHYVLAALAFDPHADVDALMQKFCAARYGDAAKQAKKALLTLEEVERNFSSIPNTTLKSADEIAVGLKKLQGCIEELAPFGPAQRNVARLMLMLQYAAKDLEIQHLRSSKADKEQIRAKAGELQKFPEQHADEGVFVIKGAARIQRRYGIDDGRE